MKRGFNGRDGLDQALINDSLYSAVITMRNHVSRWRVPYICPLYLGFILQKNTSHCSWIQKEEPHIVEVEPRGRCHSQCGQCMSVRQCHFVRNTPYTNYFSGETLVIISRTWGFWHTFLTSANNTFIYEANNAESVPNTLQQVPSTRRHQPTGTGAMKPGCYFLEWKQPQHSNEENDWTSH